MMKNTPLLTALLAVSFLPGCSGDKTETITFTGSSTVAPVVNDVAKRFEASHPGARIEVQTGGSSRGIADALSGLATFGMVSRDLKADESELTAHRFAVDGVGFIVHQNNPVADFSRQQLIDVYTGRITNWKELGGAEAKITVASKAEGRATLEVFLGYTGLDSADIKAAVIVGENQQAIKTVVADPNAIAYVSIGAAASEAAGGTPIKLVRCDGVEPANENVAAGKFPIMRPLQLVTCGEIPPQAREFLEFLKAPENTDIIESHLYVPIPK